MQDTADESRIEPEFEESRDGHERATKAVEEEGLPEDNPFADVVRELHDDGKSWREIWEQMEEAYNVVDAAAHEEGLELMPEWKVAAVVPDDRATSGERYEFYERAAETAEEAEEQIESATGFRVEQSKTEQVGVAKVS